VQAEKHAKTTLSNILNSSSASNAPSVQQAQALLESNAAAGRAIEARLAACRNHIEVASAALKESCDLEAPTATLVLRSAAAEASLAERLALQVGFMFRDVHCKSSCVRKCFPGEVICSTGALLIRVVHCHPLRSSSKCSPMSGPVSPSRATTRSRVTIYHWRAPTRPSACAGEKPTWKCCWRVLWLSVVARVGKKSCDEVC
jgi:hypothetical protein